MDIAEFIINYENDNLKDDQVNLFYQVIDYFQELVDSGKINSLQGSYQRTAKSLLDAGLIN
tara:strand:+ start:2092 stop:2274 length:183 start_codon:yes stop_codon:yes gene_type:complete